MSAEIKRIYDLDEIIGSENPNLTKWDKLSEEPPKESKRHGQKLKT